MRKRKERKIRFGCELYESTLEEMTILSEYFVITKRDLIQMLIREKYRQIKRKIDAENKSK